MTQTTLSMFEPYLKACQTPSDINEHLPRFVELSLELEAKTVIELGTRGGVSTVAWLYGMELTDGHLWSVDIDAAPDLEHDRWSFVHGNDLDVGVIRELPDLVDIVFIDTSHQYEQTLAELKVYRWKVRPGGVIVLHDTELAHPFGLAAKPRYPVKTAIEEFCFDEGLTWTNRPNCWGLGEIKVGD